MIIAPLLPVAMTPFRATLDGLRDAARRSFFDLLAKQAEKLIRSPPLYTHDLSPPRPFTEAINQLVCSFFYLSSSLNS
jgi:hypothetical protein